MTTDAPWEGYEWTTEECVVQLHEQCTGRHEVMPDPSQYPCTCPCHRKD